MKFLGVFILWFTIEVQLWVSVGVLPQGSVDGQVLVAGCLANGLFPDDDILGAGGRCVGKPIKQTFICKHWFTLVLVQIGYFIGNGEYFQNNSMFSYQALRMN